MKITDPNLPLLEAVAHALGSLCDRFVFVAVQLPSGRAIRLIAPPVFLATKFEAFHGRGGGDFLASHDLDDVTVVIDGRPELVEEVTGCATELRTYLADEIESLIGNAAFLEALSGHLPGDETSQARLPIIREKLRLIIRAGRA